MATMISDQIVSYLIQYGVPHSMIKILQEQRINNDDLRTMDRDDIEHLFKNEFGFTFRDRKQIWNAIQDLHLTGANNEIVCTEEVVDDDETPDIYEITDVPSVNHHVTQHYAPLSSSSTNILSGRVYNQSQTNPRRNLYQESNFSNNTQGVIIARTSLPIHGEILDQRQLKNPSPFQFKYPVDLPLFSSKIKQAFATNNIESEWRTFVRELAEWIVNKKQIPLRKGEFQSIGQTLYTHYPCIAKDGFRPWSHVCRCLTRAVRKERQKRGLPSKRK